MTKMKAYILLTCMLFVQLIMTCIRYMEYPEYSSLFILSMISIIQLMFVITYLMSTKAGNDKNWLLTLSMMFMVIVNLVSATTIGSSIQSDVYGSGDKVSASIQNDCLKPDGVYGLNAGMEENYLDCVDGGQMVCLKHDGYTSCLSCSKVVDLMVGSSSKVYMHG